MSLPTPTLDDRTFQDLVDEAKRRIPRHCPDWTDHNVSDPGIALIELFAWMTELLLYRVNQVPDRLYVRFLELVGITLYPAAPAQAELLFWLSGPRPDPVRIPAGTQVGTERTGREEPVVFLTEEECTVVPPELVSALTASADGRYVDRWDELRLPRATVACFPDVQPGGAVLLGFAEALPGNIVRLDVEASVSGVGMDPYRPPWAWEAWSGDDWAPCRVLSDSTLGLNADGSIVMVLPLHHEPLSLGPTRAHWLRCRLEPPAPDQPALQASPEIGTVEAVSLGALSVAHHGQPVTGEVIGRSDGNPNQRFTVRRVPVLARRPDEHVEVHDRDGTTTWAEVSDFSASTEQDRHVVWDGAMGEVRFGPRVRHLDGSVHQHGAVPPTDAEVVVSRYRHGGGTRGNVGAGTLKVLKTSIPFVARVENLDPARGGVDAETIADAKVRGPLSLRAGQRAVTASDFERLTLEAEPAVARARCLPPDEPGGALRVLIVPRRDVPPERLELDDLKLPDDLVERVSRHLDERRMLTAAVQIRTPSYQGLTVVARVKGGSGTQADLLRERALHALYAYVNPLTGGPDGAGWPFGRDLNLGEVFALLSAVPGVAEVEEVKLYLADLRRGERHEGRQRIRLPADALFASFQHQVLVR